MRSSVDSALLLKSKVKNPTAQWDFLFNGKIAYLGMRLSSSLPLRQNSCRGLV